MVGRTRDDFAHPYGAVHVPVVRSSTFQFASAEQGRARFAGEEVGLIYTRLGNPTVRALEEHLMSLENAEDALALASGMAAIHASLMAHLRPGAHLVADRCLYGCTVSLIRNLSAWGVRVTWVDGTDLEQVAQAVQEGVDVVFVEAMVNPTLRVMDVAGLAAITHQAGGLLFVDNTFPTPIGLRPLALGADLVIHSLTKSINGHSDLLGGAVMGPKHLVDPARIWQKDAGGIMEAETAFQCLRGARTLEVRFLRSAETAERLAQTLAAEGLPVTHPSLPDHPDHVTYVDQGMTGCGLLTVDVGTHDQAMQFVNHLQRFLNAVSLGGFESLVSHPASTTHACLGPEALAEAGITPGMVRLSVGLDAYEDLLADLQQAFAATQPTLLA